MNNQNILLNFEDFLNSYRDKRQVDDNLRRNFPIKLSDPVIADYAYLIGKIMGDGNLDPKFTLRFIGQKNDLIDLRNLLINSFKIEPSRTKIRKKVAKGTSYVLQVNFSYMGRLLYLMGAPIGNKVKNIFTVPNWIFSNNACKKRFLQALLEDELTTIRIKRCNYSVSPQLKMAKTPRLIETHKSFMLQVKELIESFGVTCSHISEPKSNNKTPNLDLYFHVDGNKRNIIKFRREIGFRLNQNKVRKLNECCAIMERSLEEKRD